MQKAESILDVKSTNP